MTLIYRHFSENTNYAAGGYSLREEGNKKPDGASGCVGGYFSDNPGFLEIGL